jgi:5-methylcytosine-specific restriction endonuclease McrA
MAWASSNRKDELPGNWLSIRRRILARDGYACQWAMDSGDACRASANQVDHIEPGSDHRDENLRALCKWHHDRKSAQEGVAARKPRPSQRRKPEPHPAFRPA